MAKVTAVWGAPDSGKTTFAVKLAAAIYDNYNSTVMLVCPDMETPTLPVLFPSAKRDDLSSIGAVLAKTEVTKDDVILHTVSIRGMENFGVVGFKDGENKYTYPSFDEVKVRALFAALADIAQVIVVDCTSSLSNPISAYAVKYADEVIRIAAPTLKSVSWLSSQLALYADPVYKLDRQIQGLNVPDGELYMPLEEARAHIADVRFSVPYCRAVKQQMLDGKLWKSVKDRDFNRKFRALVEKVV